MEGALALPAVLPGHLDLPGERRGVAVRRGRRHPPTARAPDARAWRRTVAVTPRCPGTGSAVTRPSLGGRRLVLTLTQRIEAGADRGHDLTFVVGGDTVAVPYRQLHEEARGLRRQPPGARRRPRRPRRPPRPDLAAARHRHPGASGCAAPRVVVLPLPMRLGVDRGVRRPDPRPDRQRRRVARARRPRPGAVHRARARRPADGAAGTPCSRARPRRRRRRGSARPTTPTRLAILQFTSGSHRRPEGRDAPAPHGRRQPRRHRPRHRRSTPTTTCSCRGCRCTTTWASSGCFMLPLTTGTPLVLGAPQDFMAAPRRWMEWLSTYGGTATAGPNFSYVLAARALRTQRRARPVAAAGRAQRRRARRPATGRGVRRGRRAARPATRAPCSRPSAWPR